MVIGIAIGYHKVYDLTTGFVESIYSTTHTLQHLLKTTLLKVISQEKPILLGSLFTAGVISYDIVMFINWMRSFNFTTSRRCKKCNHKLIREQRVFLDRILSSLIPLKRYRCVGCSKEYLIFDHFRRNKESRKHSSALEEARIHINDDR